jgi:AcrR family transcriptional regulator
MAQVLSSRLATKPAEADAEDIENRVLAAASICAERHGLENVIVDDIVKESGVPRTTIYRRFGNRDSILQAMIIKQSQPFMEEVAKVSMSAASFRSRVEQALTISIASLASYPWARALLDKGVSNAEMSLFESVHHQSNDGALKVLMESAEQQGLLRKGISPGDFMPWLIRQIIEIGCSLKGDTKNIQKSVQRFILPVLFPDADMQTDQTQGLCQRIDAIEHALAHIERHLA